MRGRDRLAQHGSEPLLEKSEVTVKEQEPQVFTKPRTGTRITIRSLRAKPSGPAGTSAISGAGFDLDSLAISYKQRQV